MQAEAGSGIRFMSDSWIAFQPAIEEPSNMIPSEKVSSSICEMSIVTCCHLPRGSVKRKSAYLTSLSLIIFMTSLGVVIEHIPFHACEWLGRNKEKCKRPASKIKRSDRVQPRFSGSYPDGFLD